MKKIKNKCLFHWAPHRTRPMSSWRLKGRVHGADYLLSLLSKDLSWICGEQDGPHSHLFHSAGRGEYLPAVCLLPLLPPYGKHWWWGSKKTALGAGDCSGEQCDPGSITRPFWALVWGIGREKHPPSLKINQRPVDLGDKVDSAVAKKTGSPKGNEEWGKMQNSNSIALLTPKVSHF